jgi:hypothetical protein
MPRIRDDEVEFTEAEQLVDIAAPVHPTRLSATPTTASVTTLLGRLSTFGVLATGVHSPASAPSSSTTSMPSPSSCLTNVVEMTNDPKLESL